MPLITLVYVSVATNPMTDDELRSLLEECRRGNAPLNVTGMLLYRNGFFVQALEGEEAVVGSLYAKIARDPRHTNILTVYQNPIEVRAFGEWSMGFGKIEQHHGENIEGFTNFMEKPDSNFFVEHPGRAAKLLNAFREGTY